MRESLIAVALAVTTCGFCQSDAISFGTAEPPQLFDQSEARLSILPGVISARLNMVCCDNAGYPEEALEGAWDRGEREVVIGAALRTQ